MNSASGRLGREFAAWLGLVPRQNSTGGKARLGGISKRGDSYLRRILINGAHASQVFWQVGSSATLGTTTSFDGSILANQSITMNTGASLVGGAYALNAAVTLDDNLVTAVPEPSFFWPMAWGTFALAAWQLSGVGRRKTACR